MVEGNEFTVHHLRFEAEALTPLALPAHAGPSIRGALWGALQRHFCPLSERETPDAGHKAVCPVCWLMATEKAESGRGPDVPRPYPLEPPLPHLPRPHWRPRPLEPGERSPFRLTPLPHAPHPLPPP